MNTQNFKMRMASAVAAVMTLGVIGLGAAPSAMAQNSRQKDKNNMRNLGIGLGALAAQQAITGKRTGALVAGAGALYAGKKYEDARKAQSKENNRETRRYRYRNGKKVGYYKYRGGKQIGYYKLR
ncbi:MAG: hypothetical protein V4671_12545 [Armatimonadota bacterium]